MMSSLFRSVLFFFLAVFNFPPPLLLPPPFSASRYFEGADKAVLWNYVDIRLARSIEEEDERFTKKQKARPRQVVCVFCLQPCHENQVVLKTCRHIAHEMCLKASCRFSSISKQSSRLSVTKCPQNGCRQEITFLPGAWENYHQHPTWQQSMPALRQKIRELEERHNFLLSLPYYGKLCQRVCHRLSHLEFICLDNKEPEIRVEFTNPGISSTTITCRVNDLPAVWSQILLRLQLENDQVRLCLMSGRGILSIDFNNFDTFGSLRNLIARILNLTTCSVDIKKYIEDGEDVNEDMAVTKSHIEADSYYVKVCLQKEASARFKVEIFKRKSALTLLRKQLTPMHADFRRYIRGNRRGAELTLKEIKKFEKNSMSGRRKPTERLRDPLLLTFKVMRALYEARQQSFHRRATEIGKNNKQLEIKTKPRTRKRSRKSGKFMFNNYWEGGNGL